jgi:hypothetical protein
LTVPYDEPDHEDPMEFMGVCLPALSAEDEDEMVRCVIEEYCWIGFSEEQLWRLFTDPFYQATHQFYARRGLEHVRRLIEEVLGRPVAAPTIKLELPVLSEPPDELPPAEPLGATQHIESRGGIMLPVLN